MIFVITFDELVQSHAAALQKSIKVIANDGLEKYSKVRHDVINNLDTTGKIKTYQLGNYLKQRKNKKGRLFEDNISFAKKQCEFEFDNHRDFNEEDAGRVEKAARSGDTQERLALVLNNTD